MKKSLSFIFIVTLLVLCIFCITSCDDELQKPDDFRLNSDTLELTWDKVPGAQSYVVEISGSNTPHYTVTNYYPLEDLAAGTYIIKVKALGDNIETKDSDYATFAFTREKETGLKYQLINNRTEYELIDAGYASGAVVMESYYRGKPVTSIADGALADNYTITSLTVGDNVKTIGDKAFRNCSVLTSVTIPNSVKSIGENLFQSSKALEKVTLSNELTTIPNLTFSWCSALKTVTMGNKVTSIGEYAFSNCKAIESINLSDSLERIGAYAFSDCEALTSIDLSGVKILDKYAFSNCISIATLNLGTSMVEIGNSAFYRCTSLSTVVFPDTTTVLGYQSFYDCSSLASVTFGKGITDIGASAFLATKLYNDSSDLVVSGGWILANKDKTIEFLTIPNGTIGIAGAAFEKCKGLTEISLKGIKYISDSAFSQCSQLMKVVTDDSLIKIGDYAFANCPLISEFKLGKNLESIGKYSFAGDSALETISLPKSLKSIGTYAFDNTKAFTDAANEASKVVYIGDWVVGFNYSGTMPYTQDLILKNGTRGIADYSFYMKPLQCNVYLPNSLEFIGRSVFYGTSVSTVVLSPSLKTIGDYAFYRCEKALFGDQGVTTIPAGVEYIGRSAFYRCGYITSLTIPSSVKTIGDYAFYGCLNIGNNTAADEEGGEAGSGTENTPTPKTTTETKPLNKLVISEGVLYIGYRAFQGCESLTEVTIPNSVTSLGTHAFYKCIRLESVTIGTGISEIPDYTFYKCAALKDVTIGENITTVGKYAFRGCEALVSIDLGNVTEISDHAFNKCISLSEATLSDSLKSIGNYAFRSCISLKSLIIPSSVEYIGKHAFYGMNETTFYCEISEQPAEWNERFNSSHRPIFYGCETSEDGYVVSIVIKNGNPHNPNAKNGITAPVLEGYDFLGWSTTADATEAEYTCENVTTAPENTTLYSIWKESN